MKRDSSRVSTLSLILLAMLSVAGCATTGMGPDLEDSTGQMGQARQPGTGAGDIYVKLAVEYLRQNNLESALLNAKKALEVEPRNAEGHNVLALIYTRLGENTLAERHFVSGLKIEPRNSYLHNAYGTVLCSAGRYDEADREFNLALQNPLYTTPAVSLSNAGHCAQDRGDIPAAESYLRRALEIDPRLPAALLAMGEISFTNGNLMSARAYLERFHAVSRPTAPSLWLGIRTERQLGDEDQAASYSLLLRNNFPDSVEVQRLDESERE